MAGRRRRDGQVKDRGTRHYVRRGWWHGLLGYVIPRVGLAVTVMAMAVYGAFVQRVWGLLILLPVGLVWLYVAWRMRDIGPALAEDRARLYGKPDRSSSGSADAQSHDQQ